MMTDARVMSINELEAFLPSNDVAHVVVILYHFKS